MARPGAILNRPAALDASGRNGNLKLSGRIWKFAMSTARARIDRAGRILIPSKLRKELKVGPGDSMVLETKGDELHLRPYRTAIREAQAIIAQYIPDRDRSLVDELIAQRRKQVEGE